MTIIDAIRAHNFVFIDAVLLDPELEDFMVEIDEADDFALWCACYHYDALVIRGINYVKKILDHTWGLSRNINTVHRQYNQTVLHLAVHLKNTELVQLLLEHGADVTVRNFDGVSSLDMAFSQYEKAVKQCEVARDAEQLSGKLIEEMCKANQVLTLLQAYLPSRDNDSSYSGANTPPMISEVMQARELLAPKPRKVSRFTLLEENNNQSHQGGARDMPYPLRDEALKDLLDCAELTLEGEPLEKNPIILALDVDNTLVIWDEDSIVDKHDEHWLGGDKAAWQVFLKNLIAKAKESGRTLYIAIVTAKCSPDRILDDVLQTLGELIPILDTQNNTLTYLVKMQNGKVDYDDPNFGSAILNWGGKNVHYTYCTGQCEKTVSSHNIFSTVHLNTLDKSNNLFLLAEKFGLSEHSDLVFVDDKIENLTAASGMGFRSICAKLVKGDADEKGHRDWLFKAITTQVDMICSKRNSSDHSDSKYSTTVSDEDDSTERLLSSDSTGEVSTEKPLNLEKLNGTVNPPAQICTVDDEVSRVAFTL